MNIHHEGLWLFFNRFKLAMSKILHFKFVSCRPFQNIDDFDMILKDSVKLISQKVKFSTKNYIVFYPKMLFLDKS